MANRTTLVKDNIKLQSNLSKLSNSLSCLKWVSSLPAEELKSTSALNQTIVLGILFEITDNAGIELPEPSLGADVDYCFSWRFEDLQISFEVDEDGEVEWWYCFIRKEGKANAKNDVFQGVFDGTKQSSKRKKALQQIAKLIKERK